MSSIRHNRLVLVVSLLVTALCFLISFGVFIFGDRSAHGLNDYQTIALQGFVVFVHMILLYVINAIILITLIKLINQDYKLF